jgi:DNA-directed RNA polymerase subunit E'/Rpb7
MKTIQRYILYSIIMENKLKFKKREPPKIESVYSRCLLSRTITLPITAIGNDLNTTLVKTIIAAYEGRCVVEGYIKPDSCNIITYSSGLNKGGNVLFEVVFECQVCFPVESMLIECVAKNITKAGIRAESSRESPSPIIVFIAKDHNYNVPEFSEIKEGDVFTTRVIGQRFELNDKYISIIGEIAKPKKTHAFTAKNR